MTSFFPNKGDEPGNSAQVPFGGEVGSKYVSGNLEVAGATTFVGPVMMKGNLQLSTGSIVDISSGTIYTFADPIIDLNTSFTGTSIPEAGLKIFRGAGLPPAQILFGESADRATLDWRIGLQSDMLRVGRIADTMTDRHALYWDVNTSSLATHPSITLAPDALTTAVPLDVTHSSPSVSSHIRTPGPTDSVLAIEMMEAGSVTGDLRLGLTDRLYADITFDNAPMVTGRGVLCFSVTGPVDDRYRYIYDGVASLGLTEAGHAFFDTGHPRMRVNGRDSVGLSTNGVDRLLVAANIVTSSVDVDYGAKKLTGRDAIHEATATGSLSYYLPDSLHPVPDIAGWDGTYACSDVECHLSSMEVTNRTKYEVTVRFTPVGLDGANFPIYIPVNIGGDLSNVRNVYGVVRQLSGGVVQRVYGLPANDVSLIPPFDLYPPLLTTASLAGYHLVAVNMMGAPGDWEVVITVETIHPLTHAP